MKKWWPLVALPFTRNLPHGTDSAVRKPEEEGADA